MKTRALISCLAAIIIAFSSNARQLSLNEAQSIAAKYASVAGAKSPSMKYVSSNGATDNEYYVFNTEDGGFVIVSGDSEMTDAEPTSVALMQNLADAAREYLPHVFLGNC